MKIIKSLFAFAAFFALNSNSAYAFTEKWPQIKAYHELISKSFKSAGGQNLEILKKNSALLLEKAEALSVENMPEEFRSPKLIESLVVLKKETKNINELVEQKADDTEIITVLTKLQDTFNKIAEMCQPKKSNRLRS